jgi:hypothetical protein
MCTRFDIPTINNGRGIGMACCRVVSISAE